MPIHLWPRECDPTTESPATRRAFLGQALAGGAAATLAWTRMGHTAIEEPAAWFAWLADTHIAADPAAKSRNQVMAENLKAVIADILAQPDRPRGALIDGDLALNDGQTEDYRTLVDLLKPLREAKIPIHLALGNHDDRDHFRAVLRAEPPPDRAIVAKHVSVVNGAGLRTVMLDSLQRPNFTPGLIGPDQLAWLERALDAEPKMPTVLFVHHNLSTKEGALTDTEALLKLIQPRRQVKAVVYGHSHRWEHEDRDGLHLVNLPAIAYPFGPDQPLGWVRAEVKPDGIDLELRCVGGERSKDRQKLKLAWRT